MTETLRPPPLPLRFTLAELATVDHLDAVEKAVGLAAAVQPPNRTSWCLDWFAGVSLQTQSAGGIFGAEGGT
jgi:hypothetical protein